MLSSKWIKRFINLTKAYQSFSKDPKTKVGALFVSEDKRVIIGGYNGFPKDEPDDYRLLTEEKNKLIIHAEWNVIDAIKFSWPNENERKLVETVNGYMFTTKYPCINCAEYLLDNTNIKTIFSNKMDENKWKTSQLEAEKLFKKENIEVIVLDLDAINQLK